MLRVNLDINGRELGFVVIRNTGRVRVGPCNHPGLPEVCQENHDENEYELTAYTPEGKGLHGRKDRTITWHIRREDGAAELAAQALRAVQDQLEAFWAKERREFEDGVRAKIHKLYGKGKRDRRP